MKIDITKKYKTQDGQPVALISDQGRGDFPLVGYIGDDNSSQLDVWTAAGFFYSNAEVNERDLVEVPETRVVYVNIYRSGATYGYPSRDKADREAFADRIACVRVEYADGQFDK